MKALKSAYEWGFGFVSPAAMCVFRALVGFFAFFNLMMLAPQYQDWFTEKGLYPVWMAQRWAGDYLRFNPTVDWWRNESFTLAVFILCCLAAFTTMLGLWSRVSSIILFICTVALHHRSPDILHSGDTLIRQWMFFLMFMPSGAMYSLDAFFKRKKLGEKYEVPLASVWPQRLVTYQLAIVYFTTVWHKWGGNMWREGTATYITAKLDEFHRFPVPAFMNEAPMYQLTTYGTLIVELALATLVFAKPLRKWVLISGILLHLYIEYSMNIPLFAFIITAGYVCFYEGDEMKAWINKMWGRFRSAGQEQENQLQAQVE